MKLNFALATLLALAVQSALGQQSIGLMSGLSEAKFLNFSRKYPAYHVSSTLDQGYVLGCYYEFGQDSSTNLRLEIFYNRQALHLTAAQSEGQDAFEKEMQITAQFAQLNFLYAQGVWHGRKSGINLLFGPSIVYTASNEVLSKGWNLGRQVEVDSSGQWTLSSEKKPWVNSTRQSKEITRLLFAVDAGLEYSWELGSRSQIFCQNRYNLVLSDAIQSNGIKYLGMLQGMLLLGLRIQL
jgi:hypothetical protein